MTIEDAIDAIDRIGHARRELTAIAHAVASDSATFLAEWSATLPALADRLDQVAALEAQLEPVLAPPGCQRWTLAQLRAWLQGLAHADDDDLFTLPAIRPSRALHAVH